MSQDTQSNRQMIHNIGGTHIYGGSSLVPILRTIERLRDDYRRPSSVIIMGESGTGKELVARAIHGITAENRNGQYYAINCGALPSELVESELFGYKGRSFTGSDYRGRPGAFELADHGTLFLDEISGLASENQVKLLRVLQERRYRPVGEGEEKETDVRVIAAASRDLRALVRDGILRDDLYYRLAVVTVYLPPLRERRDEIPGLVHYLVDRIAKEKGRDTTTVSESAMQYLVRYDWPGNIRELHNRLERAIIFCEANNIAEKDVSIEEPVVPTVNEVVKSTNGSLGLDQIKNAIAEAHGNKVEAARLLGISRATLYRNMRRLGKDPKEI